MYVNGCVFPRQWEMGVSQRVTRLPLVISSMTVKITWRGLDFHPPGNSVRMTVVPVAVMEAQERKGTYYQR